MAGGKKKAGDKKDADAPKGGGGSGGKPVKGAQSIFVRHILVRGLAAAFSPTPQGRTLAGMLTGCEQVEKHAQREQILEKLREGAAFDALAREFSQDKARQGKG